MSRPAKKRKRLDELNESEFKISGKRRIIGEKAPVSVNVSLSILKLLKRLSISSLIG
jgi:hypothetical protein